MWIQRDPDAPWTSPLDTIVLTPEVEALYRAAFGSLQRQWYAAWPNVDSDPKWYTRPNPPTASGYPPGFLKRNLDVVTLITASTPDTEGYFWANTRVIIDIDAYGKMEHALAHIAGPVDMLIVSGECFNTRGSACGVCWREHNAIGFDANMPSRIAALIRQKIKPTGLLVLGSCHAGNDPALVQQLADVVGRPVAAAVGVCRGVRQGLYCENGIYWTLGGFAEGRMYTLREPRS